MTLNSTTTIHIYHHNDNNSCASVSGMMRRGIPNPFHYKLNDFFFKNGNNKVYAMEQRIMKTLGVSWSVEVAEYVSINPY